MSDKFMDKSKKQIQDMEAKAYQLINKKPPHKQADEDAEPEVDEQDSEIEVIRDDIADLRNLERQHQELRDAQQVIF